MLKPFDLATFDEVCNELDRADDEVAALEDDERTQPRKLTRNEQLELAADAGMDTWEEWRCER